jgi:hypothetical protein
VIEAFSSKRQRRPLKLVDHAGAIRLAPHVKLVLIFMGDAEAQSLVEAAD